jgi:type I restriction enzyme M protein
VSAIVITQQVTANDYNLSPSRYVASNDMPEVLSLEDALVQLAEAEEERRRADEALDEVLSKLGFSNWRHSD